MIPTRVSHNPIIGPGVVPFGVDPAYDAQYKLNQAPRSHVASHGHDVAVFVNDNASVRSKLIFPVPNEDSYDLGREEWRNILGHNRRAVCS